MEFLEDNFKNFENMTVFERLGLAGPSADRVIDALTDLYDDRDKAQKVFTNMALCIVAADGYFAPEEYDLIKTVLCTSVGSEVSFEEAKNLMKKAKLKDLQDYIDYVKPIVDQLRMKNESVVNQFVTFSLALCAADGVVCDEEKIWLKAVLQ